MKKYFALLLTLIILFECFPFTVSAEEKTLSIQPTTWAATDGLGRTLTNSDGRREGKYVGMFYWIWHYPWCANYPPVNNAEIMAKHPEAKYDFYNEVWGNYQDGVPQFWDEPLFGYYSDLDEYVLRKHAELLADADIDVIIFDATNDAKTWKEGYDILFKVWEEAKADGVDVPQIAFMLDFFDRDNIRKEILQLYDDIYSKGRYEDLWFRWDGKPFIMANSSALKIIEKKDKEAYNFFTFRRNQATYFGSDTYRINETWGWLSDYPQTKYGKNIFGKNVEEVCVSVAQNANENGLCAMNAEGTVQGRSYTKGDYSYNYEYQNKTVTVDKSTENVMFYGLNFQQQWDYALKVDPDFIFVDGFNEWIAGRFIEWEGTPNASPDQYTPEYSRDIEPSKGVLKDYYYYQLCENVRRFKGTDSAPKCDANKTVDINGSVSQWDSVLPEYNHYTGSTRNRDFAGWKGTYYTNHTMRNDIVSAKVAYDKDNIYFLVRTKDDITPSTDNAWMRLFIDTDTSGISDNWESFEYAVNRNSPSGNAVTVERSTGGWSFEETGKGTYTVNGNVLQMSVPRSALGLDKTEEVKFNFKWSDNMQTDGDIMDFYQNGDVAPGGRFTFAFDSTAQGKNPDTKEERPVIDTIKEFFRNIGISIKKFLNYLF